LVMPGDLDASVLESTRTAIKGHPCCYFSQVYLDAAREAAGQLAPLDAAAVDEVICEGPRETIEVLFEPRERRAHPDDPYDAKFALPFQIAALLVRGDVDMTTFSPAVLADPEVARIAERVIGRATEELGRYPEQMPARVTLRLHDGSMRRAALPAALGTSPWELDSPFVAQRLSRDLGPRGDELRTVLARPDERAERLWEVVERIATATATAPVAAGR
ncbi:MAG: MmgE/PrpD family protein, partial [Alphaproteobacteria bacterium]|nr:MmgE/PrpD family protein [Alphaproteobacteria bacterium]